MPRTPIRLRPVVPAPCCPAISRRLSLVWNGRANPSQRAISIYSDTAIGRPRVCLISSSAEDPLMSEELNRRNFLKAAAIAAGPAILPARGANDKIHIGWIGVGTSGCGSSDWVAAAVAHH